MEKIKGQIDFVHAKAIVEFSCYEINWDIFVQKIDMDHNKCIVTLFTFTI